MKAEKAGKVFGKTLQQPGSVIGANLSAVLMVAR